MGEELTFDYNFERYGDKPMRCYCGSRTCRKFIGGTQVRALGLAPRREHAERRRRGTCPGRRQALNLSPNPPHAQDTYDESMTLVEPEDVTNDFQPVALGDLDMDWSMRALLDWRVGYLWEADREQAILSRLERICKTRGVTWTPGHFLGTAPLPGAGADQQVRTRVVNPEAPTLRPWGAGAAVVVRLAHGSIPAAAASVAPSHPSAVPCQLFPDHGHASQRPQRPFAHTFAQRGIGYVGNCGAEASKQMQSNPRTHVYACVRAGGDGGAVGGDGGGRRAPAARTRGQHHHGAAGPGARHQAARAAQEVRQRRRR